MHRAMRVELRQAMLTAEDGLGSGQQVVRGWEAPDET